MLQQINLYDKLPKLERNIYTLKNIALAYSVFAILLALIYFYNLRRISTQDTEIQALNTTSNVLNTELMQLTKSFPYTDADGLKQELSRLEKEYDKKQAELNILLHGRFFSAYLAALGNTIVPGVWLSEFTFKRDEIKLDLKGNALHPSLLEKYLVELTNSPVFAGLNFKINQIEQQTYPAKFHITAKLQEPI